MFLDNWLSQRAQACPERCALIADGASLTYAELEREATAAARRLAARGARRDAPVAITLDPGIEYVVVLHALMKLGAVAHPINTRLSASRDRRPSSSASSRSLTVGADARPRA